MRALTGIDPPPMAPPWAGMMPAGRRMQDGHNPHRCPADY
ncbi:hypothetical protein SXCC_04601 [Gluconacetobacter sp. SXCC-1]|nr:hypothetical protein SXCC_04601 [Gluconacetobacter sp. SXCC-1]